MWHNTFFFFFTSSTKFSFKLNYFSDVFFFFASTSRPITKEEKEKENNKKSSPTKGGQVHFVDNKLCDGVTNRLYNVRHHLERTTGPGMYLWFFLNCFFFFLQLLHDTQFLWIENFKYFLLRCWRRCIVTITNKRETDANYTKEWWKL